MAQLRQRCAVDTLGAVDVGVEYLMHFFGSECLGRANHQVPRVLHHHVQAALRLDDGGHGSIGRILGKHIQLQRMQLHGLGGGPVAHGLGARRIAPVHVAHAGIHDVSGAGQRFGGKFADAATGAGDENDGRHRFTS